MQLVADAHESFFRTSLFDNSDLKRIKHCRNNRSPGDVTLYQENRPIGRGRNCDTALPVVFKPWEADEVEFRGLSAAYGVHPPISVGENIPEDVEEDGTYEPEDGPVVRYFKVWKLVVPPEAPWNFFVDNKRYQNHCLLNPAHDVVLSDVTCDNGVLSGAVPLEFVETGCYSLKASADPASLHSEKGPEKITALLRTFIRLSNCADDCVAAHVICERLEQEAGRASRDDFETSVSDDLVIRELLLRLVMIADSYDLALDASSAVEELKSSVVFYGSPTTQYSDERPEPAVLAIQAEEFGDLLNLSQSQRRDFEHAVAKLSDPDPTEARATLRRLRSTARESKAASSPLTKKDAST